MSSRRPPRGKNRPLIATVFGTRPQFVKLSAIWEPLEAHFRSVLIDSGQHYDFGLAGSFHETTNLRRPDHHLGIGSNSPATQIGRVAEKLDTLLRRLSPDALIVFGDTSTTAGGAIAASYRNIPLVHVEAGLRSFDSQAAEEKNRVIADHLARWCFAPTETAVANLKREGITKGVHGVGDLMFESWRHQRRQLPTRTVTTRLRLVEGQFYYLTCHRAETVDDPDRLRQVTAILRVLDRPTVFAVHPRARKNFMRAGLWRRLKTSKHLQLTGPLPHPESLALTAAAHTVLTDSGGVQREAYWCQTPCLVLRDRTEWKELAACGAVRVVDLDRDRIASLLRRYPRVRPLRDRFFVARYPSRRIIARLRRDVIGT